MPAHFNMTKRDWTIAAMVDAVAQGRSCTLVSASPAAAADILAEVRRRLTRQDIRDHSLLNDPIVLTEEDL